MTTDTGGSWPFAPSEVAEPTAEDLEVQKKEEQKLVDANTPTKIKHITILIYKHL